MVALTGDARAGSPAAHGWWPSVAITGLPAVARLSRDPVSEGRVPLDAYDDVMGDPGLDPVISCTSSMTLAAEWLQGRRGSSRPRLADECSDAVLAVAALDQLCRVLLEEAVPWDGDPLGEDLGQDAFARSGRHEERSVLPMKNVYDATTGPIRYGLAKQGHIGWHRHRIRYVGLHREIGTQARGGLQEGGWSVAGVGANSPQDMLAVVWPTASKLGSGRRGRASRCMERPRAAEGDRGGSRDWLGRWAYPAAQQPRLHYVSSRALRSPLRPGTGRFEGVQRASLITNRHDAELFRSHTDDVSPIAPSDSPRDVAPTPSA